MTRPNSPEARDIEYVLHGITDGMKHRDIGPLVIERGDGVYVVDNRGKRYIEGMAGMWSVAVGFSEERLVAAANTQSKQLTFYHSFFHRTFDPLVALAAKPAPLAHSPMRKIFSNNHASESNHPT